jgi:hypothetical protein
MQSNQMFTKGASTGDSSSTNIKPTSLDRFAVLETTPSERSVVCFRRMVIAQVHVIIKQA